MAYEPCQGVIIGIMPQHVLRKNVLRLAGELSIVRVLNDFQPLSILHIFV
ncbi:nucleocapsid protein [Escherichia coli]|nr:nucleocapsid protein [Escherichia coli]